MTIKLSRRASTLARLVISSLLLTHTVASHSATDEGKYGVRGVALVSCEIFERERKAVSPVYDIMGSWIDGYVSGINQQSPGVYNVTSFESIELITALLSEHCAKNPKDSLFGVLKLLIDRMSNNKLTEASPKEIVTQGDRSVQIYSETIKRMQQKFVTLGFYSNDLTGKYDEATKLAMQKYQLSIDFKPTGFPDQLTLWRLFTD